MRALVVGAGAVGQVFGRHLAEGGAEVTFLVKEKYADEARRGFPMYRLNKRHPVLERFDGFGVITEAKDAAKSTWDQVYVTVSSTAIRSGTWLEELAQATGDATVVSLQPGLYDREFMQRFLGTERVVAGMISFISYHAPLPGETRFAEPGMAYWFPPLGPSPFSGADARVLPVVAALKAGGLPATRKSDVPRAAAFPSAILMPYLAALEAAGWSFTRARKDGHLREGGRAAAEAIAVTALVVGMKPSFMNRLAARPAVIRAVLRLAPIVIPLDFETYLQVHFTKVGDQTRLAIRTMIDSGKKAHVEVGMLEALESRLVAQIA